MANIDTAFTVESLSLNDETMIATGSIDPTIGAGYNAPIGSLFLRTNGDLYRKTGINDIDWTIVSSSSSSLDEKVKISATDTTTDYLINKLSQNFGITLSTLNAGANESLEIKADAKISLLNGTNPILSFIDTSRGNKLLSSETLIYSFDSKEVKDNTYLSIGNAKTNSTGFIIPYNATIIGIVANSFNVNSKNIDFYVNKIIHTNNLIQFVNNTSFINMNLNIDLTANDLIQFRGAVDGNAAKSVNLEVYIKWRI